MSKKTLKDSVTLLINDGEDEQGEAKELPVLLSKILVEPVSKSQQAVTGTEPMDALRVYIFDQTSIASRESETVRYVLPAIWDAMSDEDRLLAWTMRDGKDHMQYNGAEYLITSIEPFFIGSRRMWHWEVYLK